MIRAFMQLSEVHKGFDAAAGLLSETIGVPLCHSCGKCCQHNTTMAMTIEGMNAISVITGEGKLSQILSIAEGWLLERDSLSIYEGMPRGLSSPKLVEEWQSIITSQCPFMGSDNKCLAYAARPLACRAFGVTRDGYPICTRKLGKGETLHRRAIADGIPFRELVNCFKDECRKRNPSWVVSGLWPTIIMRSGNEAKFRKMVLDNKIPSAKLIGVEIDTTLIWQEQLEQLRSGMGPDAIIAQEEIRRREIINARN